MTQIKIVPTQYNQVGMEYPDGTYSSNEGTNPDTRDYDPVTDPSFQTAASHLYQANHGDDKDYKPIKGKEAGEWGLNQARWNDASITSMAKQLYAIHKTGDKRRYLDLFTLQNAYEKSPNTFEGGLKYLGEMVTDPITWAAGALGGGVAFKSLSTILRHQLGQKLINSFVGKTVTEGAGSFASINAAQNISKQTANIKEADALGYHNQKYDWKAVGESAEIGAVLGAATGPLFGLGSLALRTSIRKWRAKINEDTETSSECKMVQHKYLNDVEGIANLHQRLHEAFSELESEDGDIK